MIYSINGQKFDSDFLEHHGIKGQKWGIRRYQNSDGTWTEEGKKLRRLANFGQDLKRIKYKDFDRLMSPKSVEKERRGSCHDQVMYEYDRLKKAGYSPKAKFMIESDENNRGGTTHSFVYVTLPGKCIWIENAWGGQKGIREYSSEKEMMVDARSRWDENSRYPFLYDGDLDCSALRPGMSLGDILDHVKFRG